MRFSNDLPTDVELYFDRDDSGATQSVIDY
jgi:hypothetical protein